ncbi:MAG: hypothetical protein CMO74_08370 [Verrucomicrobiales bacterium]|nr:hypothetical protein [Verrucomicrobiales bacterium]|tara:strand:- start:17304 stop:17906 length:603 start_codon:yes stop_codon:yes gene_type:complete
MIDLFDRLNVRPEERRVAIYVFFIFFIAINGLWGWRFYTGATEWSELKTDIQDDSGRAAELRAALADLKQKEAAWEEYTRMMGADDGGKRAWTDLNRRVQQLARENKLRYGRITPSKSEDQEFESFEKHTVNLDFTGTDHDLANFLIAIAAEPQMVRVSSLTIRRPNNDPKQLTGSMSIVASFPKEEEKQNNPVVEDKKS